MKRSKPCVIAFNTTSITLLEATFTTPIEEIEQIVMEGALETGDKTTIKFGDESIEQYGTFNWKCERYKVKNLKISATFGLARVGMLTIYFKGEDEKKLKSKTIGTSAALPTALQERL